MKAVIFSTSLKNGKYSTTKAWAILMAQRLSLKDVSTEIINLKDFDYEASTDKDLLHEQLKHVYDANLIIFASPACVCYPTFTLSNLLSRFVHAHKQAEVENIDIFQNKVWEYCNMNGSGHVTKNKIKTYYNDWKNHHGYLLQTLPFLQHLGVVDAHVSTHSPKWLEGPTAQTMLSNPGAIRECDKIVEKFVTTTKADKINLPSCTLEKFLKFFESNEEHAFGRGMTLAEKDINRDTVDSHIKYVKETVNNSAHLGSVFMCMKERCMKLGLHDLAELYYEQQFGVMSYATDYDYECSGNYRPNGY